MDELVRRADDGVGVGRGRPVGCRSRLALHSSLIPPLADRCQSAGVEGWRFWLHFSSMFPKCHTHKATTHARTNKATIA